MFTQDNPSVLSTVINGVLLTNKSEIIKIYKLKTIKNYNRNYNYTSPCSKLVSLFSVQPF